MKKVKFYSTMSYVAFGIGAVLWLIIAGTAVLNVNELGFWEFMIHAMGAVVVMDLGIIVGAKFSELSEKAWTKCKEKRLTDKIREAQRGRA